MHAQNLMITTAFFLSFFASACRSDADRMAEFCLNFEQAVVNSPDCASMAKAIDKELDKRIVLYDTQICKNTTACLPCKKASKQLLGQCGHDADMRLTLDKMNFSHALGASQPPASEIASENIEK